MSDQPLTYADFSDCLLLNTVKTARLLLRRYDNRIKGFGVSVVQFSVLVTIRHNAGRSINDLAEAIAMDRTTLTRNIDLLERKGLVRKRALGRGNARGCVLTPAGDALLDELIPRWQEARDELRAALKDAAPDAFLAGLRTLANG
ncbi:MarR family winged helix-turn-helix transcriptional regulator [Pseudomonas sp. R2.Fl]|nr:MarR family winged helix-turn-helix transcriptional regulator [Pseudomonas sp. R2.Fl]